MTDRGYIPQYPTIPGTHYHTTDCPVTGKVIILGEDVSHGTVPHELGPLFVDCPWCQRMHELQDPKISSHQAGKRSE